MPQNKLIHGIKHRKNVKWPYNIAAYACLKFYMNSYRKPLFMYTYVFNMLVISNYNWLYAFLIIYKLLNKKNTNTFTSHCQSLNKFIGFFSVHFDQCGFPALCWYWHIIPLPLGGNLVSFFSIQQYTTNCFGSREWRQTNWLVQQIC